MYTIELENHKFVVPSCYTDLTIKHCKFLAGLLITANLDDLKALFLSKLLGRRAFLLGKLNEVQLAQLECLFDFISAEKLPTFPLFRNFTHKGVMYSAGLDNMNGLSAMEYAMLTKYYQKLKDEPDLLDEMCAVFYREKGKKNEYGDDRIALDDEGLERRAKLFTNLNYRIKLAVIIYISANMLYIDKHYKKVFDGGDDKKPNLGWAGTFVSLAETQILGNLEAVKNTPIKEVCFILLKKRIDADNN